ncbi:MAG: hypothetical protein R3250_16005, partial [Melioribacteraceae bacterium]|nr:hypothetical protein [Melioribacteraceae bacterium]
MPKHNIIDEKIVPQEVRRKLHDSLVLVHGGMAQDVGPILEMVTEKYLLRSEKEWEGRKLAIRTFDEIIALLRTGDVEGIGKATQNNFNIPIQTIIPLATNLYTETIIQKVTEKFGTDFWGFWMLGGMSGGGMGFIFNPSKKSEGQKYLKDLMSETKEQLRAALPFAMDPVVYEFAINEHGSVSNLLEDEKALLPVGYYAFTLPEALLKQDPFTNVQRNELALLGHTSKINRDYSDIVQLLFDRILPGSDITPYESVTLDNLLETYGFDKETHEQIRSDLQNGRIGLAQNRLPINTTIEDVDKNDVVNLTMEYSEKYHKIGLEALIRGEVGVISLAGGSGSRWTKGAGVVKGINPFCKLNGKHRTFIEIHLAKSRNSNSLAGITVPHIITTSYMTHSPIKEYLERVNNYNYNGPIYLSEGKSVGLRMVPTERDLRFFWEEMPQQILDVQAQKVKESLHLALINWAKESGEGSDYRDNIPLQCLHPTGHWYELPNILKNGTLKKLLSDRPQLKYLMMHNIDTLGANLNPSILGNHIINDAALSVEVISRIIDDRGGGLA